MLGIIAALSFELEEILLHMKDVEQVELWDLVFYKGRLGGKDAVAIQCKVGKVNAARTTAALLSRFPISAVINTGIAGALSAELNIGDIVISSSFVQHDVDVTGFGNEPGCIPASGVGYVNADEGLINAAAAAADDVLTKHKAIIGRIAKGDQFIENQGRKDDIISVFKAHCVEMETAAMAQVCQAAGIPIVGIRAMSDKADGSAHASMEEFGIEAAKRAAQIVLQIASNF